MPDSRIQRLTALIEMSALVTSSLDCRRITTSAIEVATGLLDAEAGSVILKDQGNWEMFFEVALGDKGATLKNVRLPQGCGIAGWVAEHGIPQLVTNVQDDARFCGEFDELCGFTTRQIACVPIRSKGETFGVLEAINKKDGVFGDDDLHILQALANHVAVALENARLYQENRLQYENHLAAEKRHQEEKGKLLKDLHDGVGALVANIHLLSEIGGKAESGEAMKGYFKNIAELSRDAMEEIRTFMNNLEGGDTDWPDLAMELRRHGRSMIESHGIGFSLALHLELPELPPGIFLYLSVIRIFKEALANVVKHAGATLVEVDLTISPQTLTLTITDDGHGLLEGIRMGRGLANMRTRARELGGELHITSGDGARICLQAPLLVSPCGNLPERATIRQPVANA